MPPLHGLRCACATPSRKWRLGGSGATPDAERSTGSTTLPTPSSERSHNPQLLLVGADPTPDRESPVDEAPHRFICPPTCSGAATVRRARHPLSDLYPWCYWVCPGVVPGSDSCTVSRLGHHFRRQMLPDENCGSRGGDVDTGSSNSEPLASGVGQSEGWSRISPSRYDDSSLDGYGTTGPLPRMGEAAHSSMTWGRTDRIEPTW